MQLLASKFNTNVNAILLPLTFLDVTDISSKEWLGKVNTYSITISSVQFSRSVVSDSLWPHESQHARPPCPSPTSGVHSDSLFNFFKKIRNNYEFYCCLVVKSSLTLFRAARLLLSMGFPRQEYCYFLLQGISQPRDWNCNSCISRWILYHWATRETISLVGSNLCS